MQSKIHIIGLGVEGRESLSNKALKLVESASLLIGGERHLDEFPEFKGERFVLKSNLKEMLGVIAKHNAPAFGTPSLSSKRGLGEVVVLASGDPGLYGIADYLIRNLGRDAVEIIPNVSAMQWAFAKAKVSWNDARIVSSHGRGMDKVLEAARDVEKIGIFTGDGEEPSKISKLLLDSGLSDFTVFVCEDLGMEAEKISEMPVSEIVGKTFAALNVMVLVKQKSEVRSQKPEENNFILHPSPFIPILGLPDSSFAHSKGLITKAEVRAVSLAKLGLRNDSVVWDIGAGSGSVGIEAARLCKNGKVFAIEKEPERVAHIYENIKKFGIANMIALEGKAPEGLDGFSDPDAVFIGGSGGNLSDILDVVKSGIRPSGRIVINAITLETLHEATTGLKDRGFDVDVVSLNIARSKDLIGMKMFEAENPVFIITGKNTLSADGTDFTD